MIKSKTNSAQGTIEYLIILAIVVVIALVLVGIISGFFDNSASIQNNSSNINSQTGASIIVKDAIVDSEGNALLSLQNNSGKTLSVEKITTGGDELFYNAGFLATDNLVFLVPSQNCACLENEIKKTCTYEVYTGGQGDLGKKDLLEIELVCVDDATTTLPVITPITEATFSVIYDSNSATSGSPPIDSTEYLSGETVTVLGTSTMQKEGYTFLNWKNNSTEITYEQDDEFLITSNVTLYAQWVEDTFYEFNGIIYCPDAEVGDTGEIGGVTYTAYDNSGLYSIRTNADLLERACTSKITSFNLTESYNGGLFYNSTLNPNITHWDTSNVTYVGYMFRGATSFNQNISDWNTSSFINLKGMFWSATSFNQNINAWDTSNVNDMSDMFLAASSFNQDIGGWDTSNVTTMSSMFYQASGFNQDISDWNTSKVSIMSTMFAFASDFNQDLTGWVVNPNVINCSHFNFDALNWSPLRRPNFSNCNSN